MTTDSREQRKPILRVSLSEFWSGQYGLTLVTMSIIIQVFVVTPLREVGLPLRILFDLIVAALLIAGALAIKQGRVFTPVLIAAVLLSAVVLAAGRLHPTLFLHLLGSGIVTLTLLFYMQVVLIVMFRGGPVTWGRIQGGVCVYLLLGMAWASIFQLLEQLHPGSFHFVTPPRDIDQLTSKLTYYSFGTLTTVGSDISALAPFARSLTIAEAVVGQLFPAVFIGTLVTMAMHSRSKA
jgi:voltage-gated potassium channel